MGRDKAWLEIGGRSMIERVITAIQPVCSDIHILANDPDYTQLGFPVIADENVNIGPLEAIRLALQHSSLPLVILVGCDQPFLRPELFDYLLNAIGDASAAIPIGADDRLDPLSAVYATKALAAVNELIASGERKISRLFERIDTRFVPFHEIAHLPGADLFFENVNTPEEYEKALKRLKNKENLP
jgi:molybdopterin-guanine dinucleotide biosynthesis protein A